MHRLTRLDGLRGVLAVYIMIDHALPYTATPHWISGFFNHGEAAVDLFFTLSGLVVINSLERFNYRFWPFIKGRARRLLPVYFTVLGMAVLLICVGSPLPAMPWIAPASNAGKFWAMGLPPQFVANVLAHAVLIHGLLPAGVLPYAWINVLGPAWSLSTEWQFYFVMPLILAGLPGTRRLIHFAYLMLAVGAVYHLSWRFLPGYWQFSRAFLPDAAPYFALGLASAVWMRKRDPIPFVVCLVGVCALGLISGVPSKALTAIGWTVVLLAQRNPRMKYLPQLLDSRIVQYLAAISYPLYLLNEPVQRACAMLIAPLAHGRIEMFSILWLPAAITVPVLLAMAMHHWIEAPAMQPRGFRSRPIAASQTVSR